MQDRFPNPSTFRNIALYGGQTLLFTFTFMELYVEHLMSLSSVNQLNCQVSSRSALLVPVRETVVRKVHALFTTFLAIP